MDNYDVIVIGGGPAGVISAITAKNCSYEGGKKKVLLIREYETSLIPCGIPYIFSTLDSVEKDIMGDNGLKNNNVDIAIDLVKELNEKDKTISTASGKSYKFDKLILATGAKPVNIPIPGMDLSGVFQLKKEMEYLKKLREKVLSAKNIVIIGGGFIGVEFADDISKLDAKNITIVERMEHLVNLAFDEEYSLQVEEELKQKKVNIKTGRSVAEIKGSGNVNSVVLDNGEEIQADVVIVSIGSKANVELAEKAGLYISKLGGIWVDEYLRTSNPDIFAIGDCAEKRDFFTRKRVPVMLASTATSEARIAGANLFKIKMIRKNKGTIAIFSTKVGNTAFAVAGLTEGRAKEEGFDYVIGTAESPDRHPGSLPGAKKISVKLLFSRISGTLIGGQISGGQSIGEMINVVGLAIEQGIPGCELFALQAGTHPLLTSAPTIYPIVVAANRAMANKIQG